MVEAAEFNSAEAMKHHIVKSLNKYHEWFTAEDIVIDEKSAAVDDSVDWRNEMHVCIKRWGTFRFSVPLCVGMCATEYSVAV